MEGDAVNEVKIFNQMLNIVRKKITNRSNVFTQHLFKPEREELLNLIKQSIETREGNSVLVVGPPGYGKTTMVNSIIGKLENDNVINGSTCLIVRMNGLLHTNDTISLKSIAKQLKNTSFSEEMATGNSFTDNLTFLLNQLKENGSQPCVLFILDTFHMFTEHKNQLLLYNLFDTVQSSKSPICVVGITHCIDALEMLEKRVLSRFSHRLIQLTRPVSYEQRISNFKEILSIKKKDWDKENCPYLDSWNECISKLAEDKKVLEALRNQLDLNSSEDKFRSLLFTLFKDISFKKPRILVENLVKVFDADNGLVDMLAELNQIEIALVAAARHHMRNSENEPFNFEILMKYYLGFVKDNATTMVTERSLIFKAFQQLQNLQIFLSNRQVTGSKITPKVIMQYELFHLNFKDDQVIEGIKNNKNVSSEFVKWATNPTVLQ